MTKKVPVLIAAVREGVTVPKYATPGSAGFDLQTAEDVVIPPGETVLIKTGLKMAIPEGYELQVRPRSGLSLKTKMRVANSPGTVDSDYREEICIIAENTSSVSFGSSPAQYEKTIIRFKAGERVAQGIIAEVTQAEFKLVDEQELGKTSRTGGFGSTGA